MSILRYLQTEETLGVREKEKYVLEYNDKQRPNCALIPGVEKNRDLIPGNGLKENDHSSSLSMVCMNRSKAGSPCLEVSVGRRF